MIVKVPSSIGSMLMGAVALPMLVGLYRMFPGAGLGNDVTRFIAGIDFQTNSMDGMLSVPLLPGELQVDRPGAAA